MSTPLRVTLLGTGSPSPSLTRHHPAALVEWGDGSSMLVDCGDGVVSQLLAAGIGLASLTDVAVTHLHWDHILGYPALVWGGWSAGRARLRVVGPRGTADMHRRLVEEFYRDQAEWAIDLGFQRAGWDDVTVTDIDPGWTVERDGCRIEAGSVVHPPMRSLGYRFTFADRSIVISGDTARCRELVDLAKRADVLVVDACASNPPPDVAPARRAIIERLHQFHASPQDCVDMAAEAGVAKVVLTHHLPEAEPAVDASGFDGEIVIGRDLDVVTA
ncbi:MAG: MBL fold metallo-hydrolase [Ilumatobacteraceae bacterium]